MTSMDQRMEYATALSKAWEEIIKANESTTIYNAAYRLPLPILELVIRNDDEFLPEWIEVCKKILLERVVLGDAVL